MNFREDFEKVKKAIESVNTLVDAFREWSSFVEVYDKYIRIDGTEDERKDFMDFIQTNKYVNDIYNNVDKLKEEVDDECKNLESKIDENDEIMENQQKELGLMIDELKQTVSNTEEKYQRLYADFENFKNRTKREKAELIKTANKKLMLDVIETLDNFDRAGSLPKDMEIVRNSLKNKLKSYGLQVFDVVDQVFDADVMDAVTQIPMEGKTGIVVDVVEKGYKIGDTVIRFPKVVVGA